jgi:TRAP-type C4-dicarboxylate transport system permease small subunit
MGVTSGVSQSDHPANAHPSTKEIGHGRRESVNIFLAVVERMSRYMECLAGVALISIMLLTVADVTSRLFGHPIVGTYEMVGLGGAVVIGFALPITSWLRGHIFVDFFIQSLSPLVKSIFDVGTRAVSFGLFVLIGTNLLSYAGDLYKSGEVTLTRQLPFYPIAYGIGLCCFIQCLVLAADVVKIAGGRYE